ncbi:MAG: LPS export ABC transporter permease LptF [Acidobacteriaceae bacterium]|nr:LPS export ABC transporter permease LptF [Acidobacteriaceae bacterium]
MRILTRYILREVTGHALIGVILFSFILFTRDLAQILELVVRNSAPLPSVAQIFFFIIPLTLTFSIPAGVLVGILVGLSRLAADSEITAMRASGLGIWTFLRVISIFAVAAWVLALVNGAYIAPKSQAAMAHLQDRLKSSQASFEVQPRVFYEGFPRMVLYIENIKAAEGAAIWKGVFIADTSAPAAPRITLAKQGILVSEGPSTLHLHLTDGETHESDASDPNHYQVSTFEQTDLPITLPEADTNKAQESAPISQMSTPELWRLSAVTHNTAARWDLIEFHRRFALPTSCLVLALVGVPFGLSSRKGGKSTGFVLTILFVFAYYSISLVGVALARQGKLSPALGAWLADIAFLMAGVILIWRVERKPIDLSHLRKLWNLFKEPLSQVGGIFQRSARAEDLFRRVARRRRMFSVHFPLILDDYVLRDFVLNLGLVLAAFLVLLLVFTVFELLGDIVRNQVSSLTVGEYLLNVTPYFLYNVAPLAILLAVLITLGLMQRSNEITAIKATGISIYRVVTPVLVVCATLAVGLFLSEQFYLPYSNKRQDALRNEIKGKPAQTYLNPDRKWIFGQHSTIYYYQLFDSERNEFGRLSVFQFDPVTFQLKQRIYAARAHWEADVGKWVCTQGWERDFRGPAIENFHMFDVSTFAAVSEPPTYFKKEVKQSSEMNYQELRRYIHDLQQSGFEVVRLRVQLEKKFAFPMVALVMAVLAVPFSLQAGKRSTVTGVAIAVGIALVYWTISGLFEAMGNISELPPFLAAWSPDLIFALLGGYLILRVPT